MFVDDILFWTTLCTTFFYFYFIKVMKILYFDWVCRLNMTEILLLDWKLGCNLFNLFFTYYVFLKKFKPKCQKCNLKAQKTKKHIKNLQSPICQKLNWTELNRTEIKVFGSIRFLGSNGSSRFTFSKIEYMSVQYGFGQNRTEPNHAHP